MSSLHYIYALPSIYITFFFIRRLFILEVLHSHYFKPPYTQQSPFANIHCQVHSHTRFLVISRPSILLPC